MGGSRSLVVSAKLDKLSEVRHFVDDTAKFLGFQNAAVQDMCLAVDEAVTNVILHGYGSEAGELSIEVGRNRGALIVRVCDRAPPFDPTSAPPPNLTAPLKERPIGGTGIFLMRKAVDEIVHRVLPTGGNELTLVKKCT
jgi:serine/threonine-protein kinase RsbW